MKAASAAALVVFVCGASIACNDIVSRRRSTAPLNASDDFPCDRYTPGSFEPKDGRCVVPASSVTYPFTVVVHAPETSLYAAGHTFVIPGSDLTVGGVERLRAKLPVFGTVLGAYTVKNTVSRRELAPKELPDGTSIPVRAVYTPIGPNDRTTYSPELPLGVLFASSRVDDTQSVTYVRSLPLGRWLRSFEPAPPWDAIFPPHIGIFEVKRAGTQADTVDIGGLSGDFDDLGGTSRDARITRAEGLEDWTVFLRDRTSGRRTSTLKTLCVDEPECTDPSVTPCCSSSRSEARTRLETVGQGTSLEGLEAVVAPPGGSIGLPTFVLDQFLAAQGIPLPYPELFPPVAIEGVVAARAEAGVFLGLASRVTLESQAIARPGNDEDTFLRYSTTVSTDDRGRFATVVPPGRYRITVEPLEGTRYASFRTEKVIEDDDPDDDVFRTRITLLPPRRTEVRGMALLTDGRPAANAEVIATPEPLVTASAQPTPRPGRTAVGADGTFAFDLDQGAYVVTVIPEAGTGFPRVVTRTTIAPDRADLGVLRIPPPTRLDIEIVEPSSVASPVPFANVRIFAAPETGGPLLEIGSGMTNADGRVEILLAPRPK